MDEEHHCMTLLCSFPNSWFNLVMTIGSIVKALVLGEAVDNLLLEEVKQKSYKSTIDALYIHGR
jgi:hypothetical protein